MKPATSTRSMRTPRDKSRTAQAKAQTVARKRARAIKRSRFA